MSNTQILLQQLLYNQYPPNTQLKSFKFSHYIHYYIHYNNQFIPIITHNFFQQLTNPLTPHHNPQKFQTLYQLQSYIQSQFPN